MLLTLMTALLLLLLVTGMPVAFSMAVTGTIGLFFLLGAGPTGEVLANAISASIGHYLLVSIPMFVLMAELLTASKLTRDAFAASQAMFGHVRGGLAIATVSASVMLAALIGNSTASTATLTTAAYPELRSHGFGKAISLGVLSIGGTLAIMIPPSIVFIVFGILTETSIGALFIAGIVPGLLTALAFVLVIQFVGWRRPETTPRAESFEFRRLVRAIGPVWPMLVLILVVVGTIYAGIATPMEVGALGAAAALLIILALGRITKESFRSSISCALRTTTMILTIIFAAQILGYFLTFTQVTQSLLAFVEALDVPPRVILALILLIYLFLGMFMDQLAIIILTVPLTFPLAMSLGFDPIWFGVIITKTVEIGLVSPPMGLNAFVAAAQTGEPVHTVFRGVLPFIVADLSVLVLLFTFPEICLFLTR